jgi:hypothetical protein
MRSAYRKGEIALQDSRFLHPTSRNTKIPALQECGRGVRMKDVRHRGGRNPKSVSNFAQSQSTNQSFLIEPALAAASVSAFSTLPFKQ